MRIKPNFFNVLFDHSSRRLFVFLNKSLEPALHFFVIYDLGKCFVNIAILDNVVCIRAVEKVQTALVFY